MKEILSVHMWRVLVTVCTHRAVVFMVLGIVRTGALVRVSWKVNS